MLGFKESKGIEAITHESCEDSDPLILIRILQYSSSGSPLGACYTIMARLSQQSA
jgi:hypothetical protein